MLNLKNNLDGPLPQLRPLRLGNTDAPVEIGRVLRLPGMVANWDDAAWRGIPAFSPLRNEPNPRASAYPAQIKWMYDGRTLALIARVDEPDPVVARNGGRDLALLHEHVAKDDLVAWGWNPGAGRNPAPGTQQRLGELIQAWIDTGAHCP